MKNLSEDNQSRGRDLNLEPPKYEASVNHSTTTFGVCPYVCISHPPNFLHVQPISLHVPKKNINRQSVGDVPFSSQGSLGTYLGTSVISGTVPSNRPRLISICI
jgi:hypothetical protein